MRKQAVLLVLLLASWWGTGQLFRLPDPNPDLLFRTFEYTPGLQLDLIEQRQRPPGLRPLLVFFHGGGWAAGGRAWRDPLVLRLVRDGYVAASVDYRLSHQALFPAQIEDCKTAVRYLRSRAEELGLDRQRFVAAGSSAGGHLAALIGTSARSDEKVQAVIDLYGPTDLVAAASQFPPGARSSEDPDSFESRLLGGVPSQRRELARQANPMTWIDCDDPPFLILHGEKDVTVPVQQSLMLAEALERSRVPVRLVVVPDAGHGLLQHADLVEGQAREFLTSVWSSTSSRAR